MKYFKCGKCSKEYKIDNANIQSNSIVVTCSVCNAKNVVRFGPVLIAQSKESTRQYPLNLGDNSIGRKSESGTSRIQIEDKFVSRNHANITLEEKDKKLFFFITDVNSKNGTHNKAKVKLKPELKYPITLNDYYVIGLTKLFIKYI